jgi:FkbM family methyltransferase
VRRALKPFARPLYYAKLAARIAVRMRRPLRTLVAYVAGRPAEFRWRFRDGLSISTRHASEARAMFAIFFHGVYGEIGEGLTIVDVGANVGAFALFAARGGANRVFAFEPSPLAWELLSRNVEANAPLVRVRAFNRAVAGKRGPVRMFSDLAERSRLLREEGEETVGRRVDVVEAITLADVFESCEIERCHLLKLDCEGSEHEILRAAPDPLLERIDEIRMECETVDEAHNRATMRAFLEGKGFEVISSGFYGERSAGEGILHARRRAG